MTDSSVGVTDTVLHTLPPKLQQGTLRIVPLGGLGEIGRNMAVFEIDGKLLIVDCGVLFPEEHQPGVDLILPDFSYIKDRLDDIVGLVLTHGHEDHIGAVPYLLRLRGGHPADRLPADPRADRGQAGGAPHQAGAAPGRRGRRARPSARSRREFVAVNHSIPDALAVSSAPMPATCCTPATSRWTSCRWTAGSPTCAHFARLGDEGVDLFLPDSTNAEVPGFTTAREGNRPGARGPVRPREQAHHRRLLLLARAPRPAGPRRRARPRAQGRLRRPLDGPQHGHRRASSATCTCPPGILVDMKKVDELPDDKVVLICTGSQGEPMAALSRMANRDHRIHIGPGRHGHPGLVAHPGQRERGVPRHQRPDALRRATSSTRATPRCTSRATPPAGELLYC